jgi:hypothetical protein
MSDSLARVWVGCGSSNPSFFVFGFIISFLYPYPIYAFQWFTMGMISRTWIAAASTYFSSLNLKSSSDLLNGFLVHHFQFLMQVVSESHGNLYPFLSSWIEEAGLSLNTACQLIWILCGLQGKEFSTEHCKMNNLTFSSFSLVQWCNVTLWASLQGWRWWWIFRIVSHIILSGTLWFSYIFVQTPRITMKCLLPSLFSFLFNMCCLAGQNNVT